MMKINGLQLHVSFMDRCTYQVFLQLWQHFGEDQLMVGLETLQLRKSRDEEP